MRIENAPTLTIERPTPESGTTGAGQSVVARGVWQVHAFSRRGFKDIENTLKAFAGKPVAWDLSEIASLDHIGAQLFWNSWGKRRPERQKRYPRKRR